MRLPACALALAAAFLLIPATAALAETVTVEVTGTGHGTVVGAYATDLGFTQSECEGPPTTPVAPYPCSVSMAAIIPTALTAAPDPGSDFAGWSATSGSGTVCDGSTELVCEFNAKEATTVTAKFEVAPPAPTVTIKPPTKLDADEATFQGTVNPNGDDTQWRFEYRPVGVSTWSIAPVPDGDAGSGNTPEAVQDTVDGLQAHAGYEVRLLAVLAAHTTVTTTSSIETFTTAPAPAVVVTGRAWSVSDAAATLAGTVDPENAEVSECRFEYGTTAAYGHAAPCSPARPGSGHAPVLVTAEVGGLSPGTAYHFRLVATNSCSESGCGTGTGHDAAFTTYTEAEALLPQRGFELVSAFDTNGAPAVEVEASANGERFAYTTLFQPAPGAETGTSYFRSSRNPDGSWSAEYVGPPHPAPGAGAGGSGTPLFSSTDLSLAFFTSEGIDPEDQNQTPQGGEDVYLRNEDGSFTWVSRDPRIPLGTPQTNPENANELDYVSPGGHEVVFASHRALLDGALEGASEYDLYQWREGALSLVSQVPPAGEAFCGGSGPACKPAAARLGSLSLSSAGGLEFRAYENTTNAVSRDGSRIVFQPESGGEEKSLYVRLNGEETIDASTYAPSAPLPAAGCGGGGSRVDPCDAEYWGADENDEQVFFTSSSPLTEGSTAPDTHGGPADLYRWSLPAGGQPSQAKLLDLTPAEGGAGVAYVLGVSANGRRVYFAAGAALEGTAATESGECKTGVPKEEGVAELQGCNIYFAELGGPEDTSVHLTYIATAPIALGSTPSQAARNLAISQDGRWFAFRSADALVPDRQTGETSQVYIYDAARGELSCASCTPDGSPPPTSFAVITQSSFSESGAPDTGSTPPNRSTALSPHARNIASDGSVFFQTASTLVPQDTNGREDVYAWHGGRLGLISSGEGSGGAFFGDASVDGSTVFFSSTDEYVPGVSAGPRRIYAARVGAPTYEPPLGRPPCESEDCKPLPAAPPQLLAPGSLGLFGPGNLVPRTPSVSTKPTTKKCATGKKLKQDRCVKAKAKKPRKAKKDARHRKAKKSATHDRGGRR